MIEKLDLLDIGQTRGLLVIYELPVITYATVKQHPKNSLKNSRNTRLLRLSDSNIIHGVLGISIVLKSKKCNGDCGVCRVFSRHDTGPVSITTHSIVLYVIFPTFQ